MNPRQYTLQTLILLSHIVLIHAAAGTLDLSFGPDGNGISIIDIGRNNNLIGIARLSDDTLVGVGNVFVTLTTTGACSLTSTGTLNNNFNSNGYAQLITDSSSAIMQTIAVQADEKIVIGGHVTDNHIPKFALARYNSATGTLDTSFGSIGYVMTNLRESSIINALCIQPDGKIIAGGIAGQGQPNCAIARYNPNGSVDTSFGTNGAAFINAGYISSINALALQPDGKIVAVGFAWNTITDVCIIARFNADGTLDGTFGTDGTVITQIGDASRAQAVAIQTDGKIVVGGYTTNNTYSAFCLMRYNTSGILDASFDAEGAVVIPGIVITPMNYSAKLNALVIQSDGKIVAGGSNFGLRNTTFALARYLSSGELDNEFGTNGITFTTIGSSAQINSLVIQSNGNIVAGGISDTNAALARYLAN